MDSVYANVPLANVLYMDFFYDLWELINDDQILVNWQIALILYFSIELMVEFALSDIMWYSPLMVAVFTFLSIIIYGYHGLEGKL